MVSIHRLDDKEKRKARRSYKQKDKYRRTQKHNKNEGQYIGKEYYRQEDWDLD